jgi:pyruvate dehydrogenase E1 component beta subunit
MTNTEVSYREALRDAHREALRTDPRVFVMGEDVGRYGGTYAVTLGLLEEFGPERIRDTPLSESAFVGAGIGAALGGLRPIVEVMTVNFSLLAMDPIVNVAATLRHMSGGQWSIPLVIRMATGAGRQVAAQHSHSLEHWFAHVPGLKVVTPATVPDARRMLAAALADPDPVLMFEHVGLYNLREPMVDDGAAADLAGARVRRAGTDLTIITYGGSLPKVLQAASDLAEEGVDAEVLDLRSLRPLDRDAIVRSVRRTRRALVVDETWVTYGFGAEVVASIVEGAFDALVGPVARLGTAEVPIPYARHLEEAALPQTAGIVGAAREVMRHG